MFFLSNISRPVPLGSSPEMPAKSCAEMKAIQGEEAVSGDYWLETQNNGNVVLIFCLGTKG